MVEKDLRVRGCSYHLKRMGKGTSLVMLHGFAGSADTWTGIQKRLADFYDTIAIDLLGHGQTDAPPEASRYTMQEICLDLDEILRRLELDRSVLLGYSMGGRLALYFAWRYPKRIARLILESSSAGLKTEKERLDRRKKDEILAEKILTNGMEWFVDYWRTLPVFQIENQSQGIQGKLTELYDAQKNASPVGLANSLKAMGTGAQENLWPFLKEISCKTTLICGANDKKFCTINREMQTELPDAEMRIFAHAGHRVHLEYPSEFAAAVHSQEQNIR